MLAPRKSLVRQLILANPIYARAQVTFFEALPDSTKTTNRISLFEDALGVRLLPNPQTLDGQGKLPQPVYHDRAYWMRIGGLSDADHDTGVIRPSGSGGGGQLSAAEIGLAGDGVTDDSVVLNLAIEDLSEAGGGTITLVPPGGVGFFFQSGIVNLSGVTLDWSGSTIFLAKTARLRNRGRWAEEPGPDDDKWRLATNVPVNATSLTFDAAHAPATLAVGDVLMIRGMTDAGQNALERDEVTVVSYSPSTKVVTFSPAVEDAYQVEYDNPAYENAPWNTNHVPDRTLISRVLSVFLRNPVAAGDHVVDVDNTVVDLLEEGDYVALMDNKVGGDIGGTSTLKINQEVNVVAEILGSLGNYSVRLEFPAARDIDQIDFNGRLQLIDAVVNAHQRNATILFTEASNPAPASRFHPCENAYAVSSSFEGIYIPNTDAFGSRGNAFRSSRSLLSGFRNCEVKSPKFTGAGDGYGFTVYYGRSCYVHGCRTSGCRHGLLFVGDTHSLSVGHQSLGDLNDGVNFHGANEVGTKVVGALIDGSTSFAVDTTTTSGVVFGNTAHGAGAHGCHVEATCRNITSSQGRAARLIVPSSRNIAKLLVQNCHRGLLASDFPGEPDLVAMDNTFEITAYGVPQTLFDIDGDSQGAPDITFDGLVLIARAVDCGQLVKLKQARNVEIISPVVAKPRSVSFQITAEDCERVMVRNGVFRDVTASGISFTNVIDSFILENDWPNIVGSRFTDGGGNTSLETREPEHGSGGSGEVNTAANTGAGSGVFAQKVGAELQFKSLTAGSGVTLTPSGTEIQIAAAATGETNTASNLGTGGQVFASKSGVDLRFRSILAGTGISINQFTNEVQVINTAPGETNTGLSLGTAAPVFSGKVGAQLQFRSIRAGTGIQVNQSANEIEVVNLGVAGEINLGANVGNVSGIGPFDSKTGVTLNFRRIIGANNKITAALNGQTIELTLNEANFVVPVAAVTGLAAIATSGDADDLSDGATNVAMLATERTKLTGIQTGAEANLAANVGAGAGIFRDKTSVTLNLKSLVAGTGVTLTPGADSIQIDATGEGGGEVNTASNVGGGDADVFAEKNGVDFEFRTLSGIGGISVAENGDVIEIDGAGLVGHPFPGTDASAADDDLTLNAGASKEIQDITAVYTADRDIELPTGSLGLYYEIRRSVAIGADSFRALVRLAASTIYAEVPAGYVGRIYYDGSTWLSLGVRPIVTAEQGGGVVHDLTPDNTLVRDDCRNQAQAIDDDATLSGTGWLKDEFLILDNEDDTDPHTVTAIDGATFNGDTELTIAPLGQMTFRCRADGGDFKARGDFYFAPEASPDTGDKVFGRLAEGTFAEYDISDLAGVGSGETNTASNIGADGVGAFSQKVGADLQFHNVAPASAKITVALNGQDIDIGVDETAFAVPQANVTDLVSDLADKLEALADDGAPTLAAALTCGGFELINAFSPFQTATGSQAGAGSGRSWKITGNVTAVIVTNGWFAKYTNTSGSDKTITPAAGTCVKTVDASTAATVTLGNNKTCVVHGDGTNLIVDGDVT